MHVRGCSTLESPLQLEVGGLRTLQSPQTSTTDYLLPGLPKGTQKKFGNPCSTSLIILDYYRSIVSVHKKLILENAQTHGCLK